MVNTLFGFPVSKGLKRRIAKKYFNRYWMYDHDKEAKQQYMVYLQQFEHTKVGDVVNTCSGLNGKIMAMAPDYITAGSGQLLINIDLRTSVGTCSFAHCSIELPKTKAEMEASIREYLSRPDATTWFWDIRYSPEVTVIDDDGTVTINYELERQLVDARNKSILEKP